MKDLLIIAGFIIFLMVPIASFAADQQAVEKTEQPAAGSGTGEPGTNEYIEENVTVDPFEPLNRVFFKFNDKLYFWVLKPVSKGYGAVVPEWGRIRVRNVFRNVTMPVRFVNSVLQLKINGAARELGHFIINSTLGLAGMFDIKWDTTDTKGGDEDLGQTFGYYGIGEGFYIVWPILGPSNLRDSVGYVGDLFLDPVNYITPSETPLEIHAYERVNDTSLHIGDYEDLVESAIDPYISVKDAYTQHRRSKIKE